MLPHPRSARRSGLTAWSVGVPAPGEQARLGTVDVDPWPDGTGVTLRLPNVGAELALGPSGTHVRAGDSATRRHLQSLVTGQLGAL